MSLKTVAWECVNAAEKSIFFGGLSFGAGYLAGRWFLSQPLKTGAIFAAAAVGSILADTAIRLCARKFAWKNSTTLLAQTISHTVIAAAFVASMVALKILGPVGLIIAAAFTWLALVSGLAKAGLEYRDEQRQKKLQQQLKVTVEA